MKRLLSGIFVVLVIGCSLETNTPLEESDTMNFEEKHTKDTTTKISMNDNNRHDSLNNEYETLYKKWTWDEKLTFPDKSRITNFKYSIDLLFNAWTWPDEDIGRPAFIIDSTAFKPEDLEHKYTINYDSIRIFTNYDRLDGVDRGIITKLTKDSLVIDWSTGEVDRYVSFEK